MSGGRDAPQIELIRGYQTSSIRRAVTLKSSPSAGSAVDRKPDTTQLWAPRQTSRATGRRVSRIAVAAALNAVIRVGIART